MSIDESERSIDATALPVSDIYSLTDAAVRSGAPVRIVGAAWQRSAIDALMDTVRRTVPGASIRFEVAQLHETLPEGLPDSLRENLWEAPAESIEVRGELTLSTEDAEVPVVAAQPLESAPLTLPVSSSNIEAQPNSEAEVTSSPLESRAPATAAPVDSDRLTRQATHPAAATSRPETAREQNPQIAAVQHDPATLAPPVRRAGLQPYNDAVFALIAGTQPRTLANLITRKESQRTTDASTGLIPATGAGAIDSLDDLLGALDDL